MTSTNFNCRSTFQTKQIVPSRYIPIRSLYPARHQRALPPKTAHPQPTPDTYPTTHTTEPPTQSSNTTTVSMPQTQTQHTHPEKTHQESPRPHKRRQRQRILHRPPVIHRKPQRTTKRKPNRPNQIPESHMPPQQRRRGDVPPLLHLDHEQQARHHKPGPSHDLRKPVRAVLFCPRP